MSLEPDRIPKAWSLAPKPFAMSLLLKSGRRIISGGFLLLSAAPLALAQQPLVGLMASAIAFTNVNLIRMQSERVEPGQPVNVRADRMAVIGSSAAVRSRKARRLLMGLAVTLCPA